VSAVDAWKQYRGTRMTLWIQVHSDPHHAMRGFSIQGRELRVLGYEAVQEEMEDLRGEKMRGKFWPVAEGEVFRAIPELKRFGAKGKPWLFPIEFCDVFVRPQSYSEDKVRHTTLWWPGKKEEP